MRVLQAPADIINPMAAQKVLVIFSEIQVTTFTTNIVNYRSAVKFGGRLWNNLQNVYYAGLKLLMKK